MGAAALRNLTLLVPVLAVVGAAVLRHGRGDLRPRVPAAVLATLLAWVGVLAVEAAGAWWIFAPAPTTVLGMPVETSLGWALVWGALPVLAGGRPVLWWLGLAWVDVLVVPQLDPLVALGDGWLVGEAVLLLAVAAPALVLGWATFERRWLGARVVLQGLVFTGLFGWVAPTLALARDGLVWRDVLDHPMPVRVVLLVALVAFGVPTLAAVAELWRVGRGTPFPWDPPARLVTTGPYAYLHNPMQAGTVALLGVLAAAAGSVALALGVLVALVFSVAVAEPHERSGLAARWPGHAAYRASVRGWLPRWRPVVTTPATLWVSRSCGLCRSTGDAVRGLGPRGVVLGPAEEAPVRLTRMRFSEEGFEDRGVAALARALERVSLPWAWVGWLVRLPMLDRAVQVVADACGLGPRDLPAPVRTVAP
ncbi:methyltransferase [Phycicoccus avicenniae]|uniref:methyltransferase n=1 Tax=Phycicoccus avicenniae TaxID=2828860 RepID=UPI003D2DD526